MAEYRVKCPTVGELRKALEHWPDNKPIIIECGGDNCNVEVFEWSSAEDAQDINWPAAIDANFFGS